MNHTSFFDDLGRYFYLFMIQHEYYRYKKSKCALNSNGGRFY